MAAAVTMSSDCASELHSASACDLGALEDGGPALQLEDATGVTSVSFKVDGVKKETDFTTCSRNDSADTLGGSGAGERRRSSIFGGKETERRYKLWLRAEIIGLCVLIVIVWGLLSLPIVFFYIPVEVNDTTPTSSLPPVGSGMQSCDTAHQYTSVCNNKRTGERLCAAPIMYTGTTCQQELSSLRSCLLGNDESSHPLVATVGALEDAESALDAVDNLASGTCAVEVKPFLCLYFFGLCDSYSGVSYQPTASQCKNLRDSVCRTEWQLAVAFGLDLPDCDAEFSDEDLPCTTSTVQEDNATNTSSGLGSGAGISSGDLPPTTVLPTTVSREALNCTSITCRDGFYCVEGANICNPSCHSFNQYSHSTNTAIDFLVLLAACVGVVTGVGVLVVAGLRWKKVLVFPSSLVVYQTITLLVIAFFVIVTYMDNSTLYCAHRDLFRSQLEATPFCVITGVVFYYGLLQLAVFWLCHEVALLWKVAFPFHARAFQMAHRVKYVHIVCVVICVLFPTISVIPTMAEFAHGKSSSDAVRGGLGFSVTRFPPLLCTGTQRDATFYALILPILIILMVGMTILIFVFWIIHKQHGLFKARQSKNPYKIGTAERKILIVFVYYIVLAVFALLAFTLTVRDGERFATEILRYFECERKGHNPDNPCDMSGYTQVLHVGLTSLSYILLGCFPTVNFMFVINVQELKRYLQAKMPFLFKLPKRKGAKFEVSDTPSSASTSSTTGMLPSTPQTPRDRKTFNY